MLENVLALFKYFPAFDASLGAGLLIFARMMGFMQLAPVIGRKDIPFMVKLCLSLIMTVAFIGILSPKAPPHDTPLYLVLFLNFVFGALIGYIAAVIFATITAAGDMMNMQMGLSSSVMFDPSTREQVSDMGRLFGFLGTVLFIEIGGIYWLFAAFKRGFDIFPLYSTAIPLMKVIDINYLIVLTSNVLFMGLQIAAPVLLATLAMDVILGIISKVAPQVNVFQLSFIFKPMVGVAIMIIILPLLINVINDFFSSYSQIF